MELTVIYNAECPICAREIASYRRYADARGLPLRFAGLQDGAAAEIGITTDAAARRLHVVRNGELLAGLPAFVALWEEMPRFRWLARLVSLPLVRPVAHGIYEGVLAPALHAMHRRRVARRGCGAGDPADDTGGPRV
jgi:predicted DCC family thiol-disulfide oxidoreductase YuxK